MMGTSKARLADSLATTLFRATATHVSTPAELAAARGVLDLCLSLHVQKKTLLPMLLDETPVQRTRAVEGDDMAGVVPLHNHHGVAGAAAAAATAGRNVSSQGELFFKDYEELLGGYLVRAAPHLLEGIFKSPRRRLAILLLQTAVRRLAADKELLRNYREEFVHTFMDHLPELSHLWNPGSATVETRTEAVAIFYHLALSKAACLPQHPNAPLLLKVTTKFMVDQEISLSLKVVALKALALLLLWPGKAGAEVLAAVQQMVDVCFPFKSDEFPENSPKRREYLAALDHLLHALVSSGSLGLFKVSRKKKKNS